MISGLFKTLLSLLVAFASGYSIFAFGFNFLLAGAIVVSGIIFISIFYDPLNMVAKILTIGLSALSFMALALLILAGTIGDSFHLSPSNESIAFFLLLISILGATSFFWPGKSDANT
ncbi:hypothetical protein [Pseudomonas anguilliseptica]|uniref:hypothetical protein n=2 Tax=Bacteria TaxID=2 RepID=UPI0022AED0C2|nr:hypothetical protein [Pseudomonas anguilliseptica]MCZ4320414.1 hypothetical protein [Pseudomonas anguilliseptica]